MGAPASTMHSCPCASISDVSHCGSALQAQPGEADGRPIQIERSLGGFCLCGVLRAEVHRRLADREIDDSRNEIAARTAAMR